MAWVWWLSGPVIATVLAACWTWLRARPARRRTTAEAMADHRDYLDALVRTARSRDRGAVTVDGAEPAVGPSVEPAAEQSVEPSVEPAAEQSVEPSVEPAAEQSVDPAAEQSVEQPAERSDDAAA